MVAQLGILSLVPMTMMDKYERHFMTLNLKKPYFDKYVYLYLLSL